MPDSPDFPQEWVRQLTELRLRRHEQEYDATHLTPSDFVAEVTEDLAALVELGALLPVGGEPDLWQYAHRDADEPDGLMELDGTPRVITARTLRRPMRAVGPWQDAPNA
jgi:hypothetical protein